MSMSTFKLTRPTPLTRDRLCKELDCANIYGVGGKLERSFHRYSRGVLMLVLADDFEGTNARLRPGVYSRHKHAWRQCYTPTERTPNRTVEGVFLGIATF